MEVLKKSFQEIYKNSSDQEKEGLKRAMDERMQKYPSNSKSAKFMFDTVNDRKS